MVTGTGQLLRRIPQPPLTAAPTIAPCEAACLPNTVALSVPIELPPFPIIAFNIVRTPAGASVPTAGLPSRPFAASCPRVGARQSA